eukprot:6465315-Amphidinium_carterae.1
MGVLLEKQCVHSQQFIDSWQYIFSQTRNNKYTRRQSTLGILERFLFGSVQHGEAILDLNLIRKRYVRHGFALDFSVTICDWVGAYGSATSPAVRNTSACANCAAA